MTGDTRISSGWPELEVLSPPHPAAADRTPLLFVRGGHDLMLDARWREPVDAMLAWLETVPTLG